MFVVSAEFVCFTAKMQKVRKLSDYQNILGVWHDVVMMDIEQDVKVTVKNVTLSIPCEPHYSYQHI